MLKTQFFKNFKEEIKLTPQRKDISIEQFFEISPQNIGFKKSNSWLWTNHDKILSEIKFFTSLKHNLNINYLNIQRNYNQNLNSNFSDIYNLFDEIFENIEKEVIFF